MASYKTISALFDEGSHHPYDDYAAQFEVAKELEVGGKYFSRDGLGKSMEVEIVYIGHGVALGIRKCNYGPTIYKDLYHSEGVFAGFRYNDINRPDYRLVRKIS